MIIDDVLMDVGAEKRIAAAAREAVVREAEAFLADLDARHGSRERETLASVQPIRADANARNLRGFAMKYSSVAEGERGPSRFAKGAFSDSLKKSNGKVPVLWSHDSSAPIGTAVVSETEEGLYFVATLAPGVAKANEALSLVDAGVLDGVSVGFNVLHSFNSQGVRNITKANLSEVSLVLWPADHEARVTGHAASRGVDIMTEVALAEVEAERLRGGRGGRGSEETKKPRRNVDAVVASAERDLAELLRDKDGLPASAVTTQWLTGITDTPERRLARWQSRQQAAWHAEGVAEQRRLRYEREVLSLRGGRRWL